MLSAARRIQAYWPSRAEIRKFTWFSGAVDEAGPCVRHALHQAQALAALCSGVTVVAEDDSRMTDVDLSGE